MVKIFQFQSYLLRLGSEIMNFQNEIAKNNTTKRLGRSPQAFTVWYLYWLWGSFCSRLVRFLVWNNNVRPTRGVVVVVLVPRLVQTSRMVGKWLDIGLAIPRGCGQSRA